MSKRKYNSLEIGALSKTFGKSLLTIQRWIAKNDDRLTSERAKLTLDSIKRVKSIK